jgi:phospholipase/carboxylesterase
VSERDPLPCVTVEPRDAANGSVIWMHGLGADGHDFEPVVPMLRTTGVRYVFPHAPSMPVTINGGWVMPAWYDILSLEHVEHRENEEDIRASAMRIEALIERERQRGIAPDRIVLAGFSQGAAMALHVGLRYEHRLAGIVALSGYLVLGARVRDEATAANRDTPILACHGTEDPIVPILLGRQTRDGLRELTPERTLEWHEFPMEHTVCPEELELVGTWLRMRLDS